MSTSSTSPPVSTTPYFGRAWNITLTQYQQAQVYDEATETVTTQPTPTGPTLTVTNSNWGTEALRVVFNTEITPTNTLGLSWCELTIYNLNSATQQIIIQQDALLTISAGYQSGFNASNSVIWQGRVFQPFYDREDVVTNTLRLRAFVGNLEVIENFLSVSSPALATQKEIVSLMAQSSSSVTGVSIPLEQITDLGSSTIKLFRPKVLFGRPTDYINQISETTGTASWIGQNGLNVRDLGITSDTPAKFTFGPPFPAGQSHATKNLSNQAQYTPTLKGVPRQTQGGVSFTVLMDSRPKLGDVVALDLTYIQLLPLVFGQQMAPLDTQGKFVVIGIYHHGDTYGEAWETRFECVNATFWTQYTKVQPAPN